jgi:hypothetical protein
MKVLERLLFRIVENGAIDIIDMLEEIGLLM